MVRDYLLPLWPYGINQHLHSDIRVRMGSLGVIDPDVVLKNRHHLKQEANRTQPRLVGRRPIPLRDATVPPPETLFRVLYQDRSGLVHRTESSQRPVCIHLERATCSTFVLSQTRCTKLEPRCCWLRRNVGDIRKMAPAYVSEFMHKQKVPCGTHHVNDMMLPCGVSWLRRVLRPNAVWSSAGSF